MRERNGQVLIGFKCEPALHREIFDAAKGRPVSQFMREAIVEKLTNMGFDIPPEFSKGRSRQGVGGPKKKINLSHGGSANIAKTTGDHSPVNQLSPLTFGAPLPEVAHLPKAEARKRKAKIPRKKKSSKKK
jgi:hypothetical protein